MLNLLSLALIGITATAAPAKAPDPNLFKNPTAGFEVTKPAKWQYASADFNQENLKKTKLNDQEMQAAMLKYATVPMVAMLKYPEPYDDVNPTFKVNIKPLGALEGKPATEIIGLLLPQFEKLFKDYELAQPPIEVEVSGLKGAYVRINYSLVTADDREFPTTSELWIVPRGEYFFMMGAGTRQDEKTGSRKEIQDILATVKIDH